MKRLYVIIPSILIFSVFLLLPNLTFADLGIESFIQRTLFGIVNAVFGFFVFLAALLLDFGINTFVIGFGDTFLSTGVGVAVNNTWVVVRDFVNLFFIFGFVYIGFKMILNSNDSNTRRWLVNIILAALLVNFSLFATKFVIDVSNQLAAQIAVNGLGEGSTVNPNTGLVEVKVGTEFADRMGIRSLLGTGQIEQVNGWGFIFGSAFLYLTAMFVFAAGGILLIIRFAMLNLFMVLSPLMFIGWVLPPLGDTMRRFWGMFIGRAFFAPIYFLFLYFSLQVLSGLQVSVGNFSNPNWRIFEKIDNTASVTSGNLGTIPFFILVCIFMVLSLVAANKLGADGGAKAVSLGKSFSNRVRKVAVNNSVGFATRGVNRLSNTATDKYNRLDARVSSMQGWQGKLARTTRGAVNVATLGITSDKVVRGGLKVGSNLQIDGSETADDVDKQKRDRQKLQNKTNDEIKRGNDFSTNRTITENTDGVFTPQEKADARNRLAAVIKRMSDDELQGIDLKTLLSSEVAMHLSDAQIKMLKDSGLYSNDDITTLKKARDNATFSESDTIFENVESSAGDLEKAFEDLSKTIKGLSEERLQNMDFARLSDERFAANLSESQVESLQKSGNFTSQQMGQIRSSRENGLNNVISGTLTQKYTNNNTAIEDKLIQKLFSRSTDDIGKLPISVFKNQKTFKYLTPVMLEARIRNGLSNSDSADIRSALLSHLNAPDPSKIQKDSMWGKWKGSNSVFAAQFFS